MTTPTSRNVPLGVMVVIIVQKEGRVGAAMTEIAGATTKDGTIKMTGIMTVETNAE
jgi:hypothetical protein